MPFNSAATIQGDVCSALSIHSKPDWQTACDVIVRGWRRAALAKSVEPTSVEKITADIEETFAQWVRVPSKKDVG